MPATRTASTFAPPVMEARRWLDGVTHPEDRPLINVSQAAPVEAPPIGSTMKASTVSGPSCRIFSSSMSA